MERVGGKGPALLHGRERGEQRKGDGESGREGTGEEWCLGGAMVRLLGFLSHYIYLALDIGPENSCGLGLNFGGRLYRRPSRLTVLVNRH
jgi:hypothetical protein